MKTALAVGLVAGAAAVLLPAGGCVALPEHQRLLAANRRVNEQLDLTMKTVDSLKGQNSQLKGDLSKTTTRLDASVSEVATLQEQKQLLAAAMAEARKRIEALGEVPPPVPIVARVLPAPVDEALVELQKANPDLIAYYPKHGMVKIKSDLTFDPGQDFVKPAAADALTKFVTIINSPQAANLNVFVAGHTDDIPIGRDETRRRHPNNWYLSVHRAVAVQQVLTKAGLDPDRVCAMGFGEYHPVEPNKPNKAGNPANRRVEIWLVPADRFLTGPSAPSRE